MPLHHIHLFILRLLPRAKLEGLQPLDTLGFEPRAFRMRSGCDTTTPCALEWHGHRCHSRTSSGASGAEHCAGIRAQFLPQREKDVMPLCQVASDSAAQEQHQLCASSALYVQRASQSSVLCACLKYPGGCTTSQVKAGEATAHPLGLAPRTFHMCSGCDATAPYSFIYFEASASCQA